MDTQISPPLAAALQAGRARYNAMFAAARRTDPSLDGEAFADVLRTTVDFVAAQVNTLAPERVPAVVDALAEVALELLAKQMIGPAARDPVLAEGWGLLLAGLAGHVAAEPQTVVAAVTNALCHLGTFPGARHRWVDALLRGGPLCRDVPTLLDLGKAAAWRAGLAHYRDGALGVLRRLPDPIARSAMGLPADAGPTAAEIADRLAADPWTGPERLADPQRPAAGLKLVARVGAFRGFGGDFANPPTVAAAEGRFFVRDRENCWLLHADAFGAVLHRLPPDEFPPAGEGSAAIGIDKKGRVFHTDGRTAAFGFLAGRTSAACDGTTLAVTVPLSHRVYLIAAA